MASNAKISLILMVVMLVSACKMGPNYVPPPVIVPEEFKEAAPGWKVAEPCDDIDRGCWWEVFNDLTLNSLEAQLEVSNQNIAAAEAKYQQAYYLVEQARAGFFPTLTALTSDVRQKPPDNSSRFNSANSTNTVASINSGAPANSITGQPFSTYLLSLNASWEPDVWGAVRRSVEMNESNAEASGAQLASTALSMQASLAQFYFQVRLQDAYQKLLDETVIAYRQSLKLTQNRYAAGVATQLDVVQADTQLKTAEAAAVDNGILRAQYEHAIAVLIGQPPSCFTLKRNAGLKNPPHIPTSLPSELLERRPDIAASERLVAAANAQIGVVIAGFFPALSLTGNMGNQSNIFNEWLVPSARFWSLGAQITQMIFDGGLNMSKKHVAEAAYDQTVANYRQTVLTAFQEVEDNLVSLKQLNQEIKFQRQGVQNAEKALAFAMNQYKAGLTFYLTVLTAQNTLYTAKRTLLNMEGRRLLSTVGLIKALGGGWD